MVTTSPVPGIAMPVAFAWTVVGAGTCDASEVDVVALLSRATSRPLASWWVLEAAVVVRQQVTPSLTAEDIKALADVFDILLRWDREARGEI